MMKLLFIIPLLLCMIWYAYLSNRGYTLAQGKQGFIYIGVLSAVVLTFFSIAAVIF